MKIMDLDNIRDTLEERQELSETENYTLVDFLEDFIYRKHSYEDRENNIEIVRTRYDK